MLATPTVAWPDPPVAAQRRVVDVPVGARGAGVAAATAALCWLRWREIAGRFGRPALTLFALWMAAMAVLAFVAVETVEGAEVLALAATAGAWLAWAVAPVVGVGGNEVASSSRLAPYPVPRQAQFFATWLSSAWDLPALLIAPVLAGCSFALGGPAGLLAAVLLAVAATAAGQAGAWSAVWLLAGRGWKATASVGGGAAALVLAAGVTGFAGELAAVLPSGWAWRSMRACGSGAWVEAALWAALLATAAAAATAVACAVHPRAVAAEQAAAGSATGMSVRRRPLPRGRLAALTVVALRSVLRAPTTKMTLVSTQVAPLLARAVPAADAGAVPLDAVVSVVAFACTATLGLNVFAYDAGGATVLLAAPVSRRLVALSRQLAVLVLTAAALAGALVVAAVSGTVGAPLTAAAEPVVAYSFAAAGMSIWWSVRAPHSADHDSLRSRPAPARSATGFVVCTAVLFAALASVAVVGPGASAAAGLCVALAGFLAAGRRLERDPEAVAVAVGG